MVLSIREQQRAMSRTLPGTLATLAASIMTTSILALLTTWAWLTQVNIRADGTECLHQNQN